MKKTEKKEKKHILIFGIVIMWCFLKTTAYIVLAYLAVAFLPYLIPKNSPNSNLVEDMPENCKEIYEMYKAVEYDSIEIMTVYMENDKITIVFRDKTEERANYQEINQVREVLESVIDESTGLEKLEPYDIRFESQIMAGIIYSYELTNNSMRKVFLGSPDSYAYDNDGWWIEGMKFENWDEMEKQFCYVEGVAMCNIMNMDSIYNANPSEWENLKYLNVCYHGEDADMYEAELKRLFPDCEITLD